MLLTDFIVANSGRTGMALCCLTAFLLAGCAGVAKPGPISGCAAEETALRSAAAWFLAPERAGITEASYQAVLAQAAAGQSSGAVATASQAQRLSDDLSADGGAFDRLAAGYGDAQTCRMREAFHAKSTGAAAEIPALRQSLDQLRTTARVAAARGTALASIYGAQAERLASDHPGVRTALARANAPTGSNLGYKVMVRGTIYTAPDTRSGTVAIMRKGQRVSGPPGQPKPGWVTLGLNDGSIGYAMSDGLRPLTPNSASLRGRDAGPKSSDPVVAALLLARRILPEKIQAVQAQTDEASEREARLLAPAGAASS